MTKENTCKTRQLTRILFTSAMIYLLVYEANKIDVVKNKIFLLILFFGAVAFAEVNPISGELILDTMDLVTKEAVTPFKIQRQYNHKIKSFGIFGNNWCSQLEETVVRTNTGLEIRKCGQVTSSVFAKVEDGYANSAGTEVMKELPNNAGYMRIAGTYIFGYNDQGLLSLIALKSQYEKPFIRIYYNKYGMIDRVVHHGKQHYFFTYAKTEKVVEKIEGPKKIRILYNYDKNNNLTAVENAWKKKLTYGHDDQWRINSFTLPDESKYVVTYDKKLDAVSKLADGKNCGREFTYKMNVNNALLNTTVKDICGKTTSEFNSTSSPLFSKNRFDKASLYRAPTGISEKLLSATDDWKKINTKDIRWEYQENNLGYVSQIKKIVLATKAEKNLTTKYVNERLVELELKGESKVNFKYSAGKLQAMDAKNYAAFELYTEFLLARNGANNE